MAKNGKKTGGVDLSSLLAIIAAEVFTKSNFKSGSAITGKLLPAAVVVAGGNVPEELRGESSVTAGIRAALVAGGATEEMFKAAKSAKKPVNGPEGFGMYSALIAADPSAKSRIHESLARWAIAVVTDAASVNAIDYSTMIAKK